MEMYRLIIMTRENKDAMPYKHSEGYFSTLSAAMEEAENVAKNLGCEFMGQQLALFDYAKINKFVLSVGSTKYNDAGYAILEKTIEWDLSTIR